MAGASGLSALACVRLCPAVFPSYSGVGLVLGVSVRSGLVWSSGAARCLSVGSPSVGLSPASVVCVALRSSPLLCPRPPVFSPASPSLPARLSPLAVVPPRCPSLRGTSNLVSDYQQSTINHPYFLLPLLEKRVGVTCSLEVGGWNLELLPMRVPRTGAAIFCCRHLLLA